MRRSRLAKQKEAENEQRARDRTMQLVSQLKQQEIERDRMMRLRQLEMEKAEQLRKPTEDLLVRDLHSMPPIEKLDWVKLPNEAFANLLMVFEFSHSFEEFLELDSVPKIWEMYGGLYNLRKWSTSIPTGDKEVDEVKEEKGKGSGKKEEEAKNQRDKEEKDKRGDDEDKEREEEGTNRHEFHGVKALMQLTVQLVSTVVHEPGIKVRFPAWGLWFAAACVTSVLFSWFFFFCRRYRAFLGALCVMWRLTRTLCQKSFAFTLLRRMNSQ